MHLYPLASEDHVLKNMQFSGMRSGLARRSGTLVRNTMHGLKPKNIDEYLASVSDDKRAALKRLRRIIRAAVPNAEGCISYQLPAFRLDGKCFVWFGAAANHCAIYGVVGDHKDALKDYDISKGTIRFQADKALPAALVRKLIEARIAGKGGRSNKK
jgi:uncharacterized protein YdhG (YjbR/CyaY superfamily)